MSDEALAWLSVWSKVQMRSGQVLKGYILGISTSEAFKTLDGILDAQPTVSVSDHRRHYK